MIERHDLTLKVMTDKILSSNMMLPVRSGQSHCDYTAPPPPPDYNPQKLKKQKIHVKKYFYGKNA